jgi:uncharacterized protein YggT (Ycf19 family)
MHTHTFIGQVINTITSLVIVVLLVRLILKILGANPAAGFSNFIYNFTATFLSPFANIFPSSTIPGGLIEWSTIAAMIVYAIIGYGLADIFENRVHTQEHIIVNR